MFYFNNQNYAIPSVQTHNCWQYLEPAQTPQPQRPIGIEHQSQ